MEEAESKNKSSNILVHRREKAIWRRGRLSAGWEEEGWVRSIEVLFCILDIAKFFTLDPACHYSWSHSQETREGYVGSRSLLKAKLLHWVLRHRARRLLYCTVPHTDYKTANPSLIWGFQRVQRGQMFNWNGIFKLNCSCTTSILLKY